MKSQSDADNHKNRDLSRKKEIIAICGGKCKISLQKFAPGTNSPYYKIRLLQTHYLASLPAKKHGSWKILKTGESYLYQIKQDANARFQLIKWNSYR